MPSLRTCATSSARAKGGRGAGQTGSMEAPCQKVPADLMQESTKKVPTQSIRLNQ